MLITIASLLRVLARVTAGNGLDEDVADALIFGANLLEVGVEGKAELEALVKKWEGLVAEGRALTDEERAEQRDRSDELSSILQSLADAPDPED